MHWERHPVGVYCGRNLILVRAASRWGESTDLWVDNPLMAKNPRTSGRVNTHTRVSGRGPDTLNRVVLLNQEG
jgi:hypothetical protein